MNIDTGRLIDCDVLHRLQKAGKISMSEAAEFIPIPRRMSRAAEKRLAGKPEATVNLQGGSKLAKWAEKKRAARRKAEKLSRRRNRGT